MLLQYLVFLALVTFLLLPYLVLDLLLLQPGRLLLILDLTFHTTLPLVNFLISLIDLQITLLHELLLLLIDLPLLQLHSLLNLGSFVSLHIQDGLLLLHLELFELIKFLGLAYSFV